MGTVRYYEGNDCSGYVLQDTASVPWVKQPIGEYDIGGLRQILCTGIARVSAATMRPWHKQRWGAAQLP